MANDDMLLSDDYVAGLLAKDAKESSIKYSSMGLDAFKQSRPPANKPKPNTRFLRNIIKDTDSHNAALLAKEASESRSRLQGLVSNEHREERASRVGGGDIRRRQLGDIAAILSGRPSKSRRVDDSKRVDRPSRRVNTSSEDEEPERQGVQNIRSRKARDEELEDRGRSRHHRHRLQEGEDIKDSKVYSSYQRREKSISRDREDDKGNRKRQRSTSRDRRTERDERKQKRSRSRSPRGHRTKESRHHHRTSKRKRSTSSEGDRITSHRSHRHQQSPRSEDRGVKTILKTAKRKEPEAASDSDPLDEIIGPRPPPAVRSRGRGALSQGSGIDDRFSASYDPTVDVHLDPDEENDWDQALEALRDRQRWKQAGADRLRAAGFTDEEIAKWEKGGEKREEDVKWGKHGESREWDRGKVIDSDGLVNVDLNWGRLKDT